MKRYVMGFALWLLAVCLPLNSAVLPVSAEEHPQESAPQVGVLDGSLNLPCKSAVLMEAETGTILYAQNPDEALPPASVTKIMTLLLVAEALEAGQLHPDDRVTASKNAASMGGSQVFLKEGEQMPLEEMLKCVIIASANDAAVALAEHLCGSVDSFVARMNERAGQLGMSHTTFENVTGLDDTAEHHLTSALDIAIMSRQLIRHPIVLKYSSKWMDTIRDGAFGLTNTNRLVRYYQGCTGLKTGSTSKAGFCVSATAKREGFSLIAVIVGAETRDIRNAGAASLLDWGFANYGMFSAKAGSTEPIPVTAGVRNFCKTEYPAFCCVLQKSMLAKIKSETELPDSLAAPVEKGAVIGTVRYFADGKEVGRQNVRAAESVGKINYFEILRRMLAGFSMA